MPKRLLFFGAAWCAILLGVSCATPPLEQAFRGKLPPAESNKTVQEYCTACHVHVNFRAEEHIAASHQFYDRLPYQNANECRICHYVQEEGVLLKSVHRGTRWPQWVQKGKFKSFEERELARSSNHRNP